MSNFEKYGNFIKSVYIGGSCCHPYIENPNDIDYIIIVEDIKDKMVAELFSEREPYECYIIRQVGSESKMLPRDYMKHFSKLIYGTEYFDEEVDIFSKKEEYKKCLVECAYNKEYNTNTKMWYHVLTGIYFLQNGKYELTEYQAEQVRKCHDKQMDYGIYRFIQHELSIYK